MRFQALSAGFLLIIWGQIARAAEPGLVAQLTLPNAPVGEAPVVGEPLVSDSSKDWGFSFPLPVFTPSLKPAVLSNKPASTTVSPRKLTFVGLGESRDRYLSELLNAVFALYPGEYYSAERFAKTVPHHRTFYYLEKHEQVDIVIGYATEEREDKFRSIPIPLLKGLNSWRLSVVHKDNREIFRSVKTLEQLRNFLPGMHPTWTDYKILKANQLPVVGGVDFIGLYYMLNEKRFDYFLRSVLVIDKELESFNHGHDLHLTVDPYLIIKYPTALYLYVNKDEEKLADDILNGLDLLIKNGEFDRIFMRHFGDVIRRIQAEKRTTIDLTNPLLPASVPLQRKELWIAD